MRQKLWMFFIVVVMTITSSLSAQELRRYYPAIEPYRQGFLPVGSGHEMYWEESGNPKGVPILFLHGGPGIATQPANRRFFDPAYYRIILFDQRGTGKSKPASSLQNNTTWDLVSDIEKLRALLNTDRWFVFGGSWGSTLALCYAIKYPGNVQGLILRGVYLVRPKEIQWFYQSGANLFYPDEWEKFVAPIPEKERGDLLAAYHQRLTSSDQATRRAAALAWSGWEGATAKLIFDPNTYAQFTDVDAADTIARMESHYFINNSFMPTNNWILENAAAIKDIPGVIVHGRYDIPCSVENAWELHKKWPKAKLEIIATSGHAASEPNTLDALIRATDSFKR